MTLGIFKSHMHQYFFKWLPVYWVVAARWKYVKRSERQIPLVLTVFTKTDLEVINRVLAHM